MKVLWLVSTIFPYPSKKMGYNQTVFGGWLQSLFDELIQKDNINMAILSVYNGKKLEKFIDKNVTYYLIPDKNPSKYRKDMESQFKKVIDEYKPDIIHIHGTEYPRGLELINSNYNNIPVITSIQGLTSKVAEVYYGNIKPGEIIKNITFRDVVKFNTIFDCQRDFTKRGIYEKEIIKKSEYIIGKTIWDKSNILAINKNIKYYRINEILRPSFYEEKKWDIANIERHSLFCSQSSYPIKGLHILLKSIFLLKNEYKDLKLYISGMNIIDDSTFMSRVKRIGYGKYVKKLVKKYNIEENIVFTGFLNDSEVRDRLIKTHIFISPSFIENESNSLSEAMVLGVPAIGSYVGGVTERIIHGKTGYHYPVTDPELLAYYIKDVFDNDDIAIKFSKNSKEIMSKIVSKDINSNEVYDLYKKIIVKE